MESKSRRSVRASGATGTPIEPVKPPEAKSVEVGLNKEEPPKPAELMAEAAEPAETAVEVVTAAAAVTAKASNVGLAPVHSTADPDNQRKLESGAAPPLVQSQAALARGLEAMTAELAGLTLFGMSLAARTATKLLSVKTLADVVDVNAGFAYSSFDALVGGSVRLSETGMSVAADVSRALLGKAANSLGKAA